MSDVVFSPAPHALEAAPGSAELVYLRRALFVIRGMYFDPITQSDQPLPPHRWVLYREDPPAAPASPAPAAPGAPDPAAPPAPPAEPPIYSESQDSDDGFVTIFETQEMRSQAPDATWNLMMIPIFPGTSSSENYASEKGAWIDVDRHQWVPESDQKADFCNTRRLLRIPLWSTRHKITSGGGFAADHPNGADFEKTGLLKTSELLPYGSRSKPWRMQVDQGWFRGYVQFHYYDPVARKDAVFEQGLLVRGTGSGGGSTVRLDSKCIYVLHVAAEAQVKDHGYYSLSMAMRLRFAFDKPKEWTHGTEDDPDLQRLGTHYDLPDFWSTEEGEAWDGPGAPSAANRKLFSDVRTHGTSPSAPLCFHLDDLVLTNAGFVPVKIGESRVAVLDNLLKIKNQASGAKGTVPYSTLELKKFPLRAEEWYYVPNKGLEDITRAIDYGGHMFLLDRRRSFRGLRAAAAVAPTLLNNAEVFLVDTSYLKAQVGGQSVRIAQLLCYIPCVITTNKDDDLAGVNPAKAYIPLGEHLLQLSAEVWDQKHPAHGDGKKKEYFLVPKKGLSGDAVALRLRYHFGARSAPGRLDLGNKVAIIDENLSIELHPVAGRATGGSPMHLFLKFGPKLYSEMTAVEKHTHVTLGPGATTDFEPGSSSVTDRLDRVETPNFTLAHELGHEFSLPDEYPEKSKWDKLGGLPAFFRLGENKSAQMLVFMQDWAAMMHSNYLPRLRFVWPLVQLLKDNITKSAPAAHWLKKNEPFVVEHVSPSLKIRYDLGEHKSPWSPHKSGRLAFSDLALYPLGDDEGSLGPMFIDDVALGSTFDGVVVVAIKYWFSFIGGQNEDDQAEVVTRFARPFTQRAKLPHFVIAGPAGATEFKRVAVLVQPRIEVASHPSAGVTAADADLEVRVTKNKSGPSLTLGPPGSLTLGEDQVNPYLVRVALQPAAAYSDGEIRAIDLEPVNAWLATQLGRVKGTVGPY